MNTKMGVQRKQQIMAAPASIIEIEPVPELLKRGGNRAQKYDDVMQAVKTAHERGHWIQVSADRWSAYSKRGTYMSIRRSGLNHNMLLGIDQSQREEGIITIWVREFLEGNSHEKQPTLPTMKAVPVRRGPGRPRKQIGA